MEKNAANSVTIPPSASRPRGRKQRTPGSSFNCMYATHHGGQLECRQTSSTMNTIYSRARSPRCAPQKPEEDAHGAENKQIQCNIGPNRTQRGSAKSCTTHRTARGGKMLQMMPIAIKGQRKGATAKFGVHYQFDTHSRGGALRKGPRGGFRSLIRAGQRQRTEE